MSVFRVCGGVRVKRNPIFLYRRACHRAKIQKRARMRYRARLRYVRRLYAYRQRYGAHHVFAARLSCAFLHGKAKIYAVHVYHAEYRGESRRHAHSVRQPAKFISVREIQYSHGRIYADYASAVCVFRARHRALLYRFRQAGISLAARRSRYAQ